MGLTQLGSEPLLRDQARTPPPPRWPETPAHSPTREQEGAASSRRPPSLPGASLSLGRAVSLNVRPSASDEGLETFVPLNFARELYLATEWRPGVGSLNKDSNTRAIFKLPENPPPPQNILHQNDIYGALWAFGREGVTLVCLQLSGERFLSAGSGARVEPPET